MVGSWNRHLVFVGEEIRKTTHFTREDIMLFAQMSLDANPMHRDLQAAQRASFPDILASGQHTAAVLMGFMASHFSRQDDGLRREMLCLNTNFAFKLPVFADQPLELFWRVQSAQWNNKLGGVLVQLDGHASVSAGRPCVVARATILVKEAQAPSI